VTFCLQSKMITPGSLAESISTLDRAEDLGLFSQDVLLSYPQLTAEYTAICPVRMDLATMQQKARKGDYHQLASVESARPSRSRDLMAQQTLFDAVMADVRLMTGNCIKFNQLVPTLVESAKSLEAFAERTLRSAIFVSSSSQQPVVAAVGAPTSAAPTTTRRLTAQRGASAELSSGTGLSPPPTTVASAALSQQVAVPSREALKQRILSWNRAEETHMFLDDVIVTYPMIAEAYKAVCPNRMWLNRMAAKASSGQYWDAKKDAGLGDAWKQTLRDRVLADVALIAENCIKFNGAESAYAALARQFQEHATSSFESFLLEFEQSLSSASATAAAATRTKRARSPDSASLTPPPVTAVAAASRREPTPPPPPPPPPELVAPIVVPLPFQPTMHVPTSIRQLVVQDYLQQSTARLQLLLPPDGDGAAAAGSNPLSTSVSAVVQQFFDALQTRHAELMAHSGPYSVGVEDRSSATIPNGSCSMKTEDAAESEPPMMEVETKELLCAVASRRLEVEIPLVKDVLLSALDTFDAVCQSNLLYAAESIDADRFAASSRGTEWDCVRWRDCVSVKYFVRFLLHLPQLLSVASSDTFHRFTMPPKQSSSNGSRSTSASALRPLPDLQRMGPLDDILLRRVGQVVTVVEMFWCFLDAAHSVENPLW
jgi:hypothetical protein